MTKADPIVNDKAVVVKKFNSKKQVRVGLVGCGGIGRVHMASYAKVADAEIVAACDLNQEKLDYAKSTFGIQKTYLDYNEMFETEKLDAVVVAVPNVVHAPIAIAALKTNHHVFCEKPMSINSIEAQKMFDTAKASNKIFMMGFNNRYRGDSQVLKSFIDKGVLGDIYYARCGWVRRMGIPGMGGWFTQKEQSGGGPLIDIGVHVLDLTMWLLGNPKPVMAFGSTYAKFGPEGRGMGGWGVASEKGSRSPKAVTLPPSGK
jgi:predicted dehydrogenase